MSTLKRKRHLSGVQFIDTTIDLINHTNKYFKKLPKSTMFTWQQDMIRLLHQVLLYENKANVVMVKSKEEYQKRKDNLTDALGCLNSFECLLQCLEYDDNYFSILNEFAFKEWGRLIIEVRKLLLALIKKNEEKGSAL